MGLFKQTKKFFNKTRKKSSNRQKSQDVAEDLDPMQKYKTVGEYHVDSRDATPDGRAFTLTVYKDEQGVLHQALSPEITDNLAPEYERRFSPQLNRFKAFRNKKTGRRYTVEKYLDKFVDNVKGQVRRGENSVNIGIITDTHFKNVDSPDFYGWNGLVHLREFSYLDRCDILNLKCHLGDWIDGSDAGLVSESELMKMEESFHSSIVPYLALKGEHDENDKFDELHDLKASFPEHEFDNIMWTRMYKQPRIHYISRQHGVAWFDLGDLRIISLNTSDVPYILNDQDQKKYDIKLNSAVREDQIQELIEILQQSSDKQIILMSHICPINRKGVNNLKYNGRSLHELLVAFNQKEKGRMHSGRDIPPEFRLANDFDFTYVKNARIIAYFAGHAHLEDQYRINGIQYVLFNCSALMGPDHQLTTKYNKNFNRKLDHQNEFAGYIANVDLKQRRIKIFGYGAASKRRMFFI